MNEDYCIYSVGIIGFGATVVIKIYQPAISSKFVKGFFLSVVSK